MKDFGVAYSFYCGMCQPLFSCEWFFLQALPLFYSSSFQLVCRKSVLIGSRTAGKKNLNADNKMEIYNHVYWLQKSQLVYPHFKGRKCFHIYSICFVVNIQCHDTGESLAKRINIYLVFYVQWIIIMACLLHGSLEYLIGWLCTYYYALCSKQ